MNLGETQEASRTAGSVVDALTDAGRDDLDHGADERTGSIVFAAVAHVLDLRFIEVR